MAQGTNQVQYTAAPGQPAVFTNPGPTPLANGNSVWIGSFDTGFNVSLNADDPAALLSAWNSYGQTTITTLIGQPGRFAGNSAGDQLTFGGQKIYLWIFSTSGSTAPQGDFSNVNQYGIFSSTALSWIFPPDPFPNNLSTINSSQINQAFYGSFDPTHIFLQNVSPVPEPGVIGLLGLAVPAAFLAFRKRARR